MALVFHAPKGIQLFKLLVRSSPEVRVYKVLTIFFHLSLDVFLAHTRSIEEFPEVNLVVTSWFRVEKSIGSCAIMKTFETVIFVSELPIDLNSVGIREALLRLHV